MFTAEPDFRKSLQDYVDELVSSARAEIKSLSFDESIPGHGQLQWPFEAIDRAEQLERRLFAGVTSVNSFKRALSSLRRAALELEGFIIWACLIKAPVGERSLRAATIKSSRHLVFRGCFLDGPLTDWMDTRSTLRSTYVNWVQFGTPIYALVKQDDWMLQPSLRLPIGRSPFLTSGHMQGA